MAARSSIKNVKSLLSYFSHVSEPVLDLFLGKAAVFTELNFVGAL